MYLYRRAGVPLPPRPILLILPFTEGAKAAQAAVTCSSSSGYVLFLKAVIVHGYTLGWALAWALSDP